MKRCLWMIFMVVGIWMLTGCSSDDDKLDSLPWNDKELFNQSFVLNQDGYCILDGKAPVCDIDRNVLNSWLVSYGWQPVGIYQVKENDKLAKTDYREGIKDYSPKVYEFLSENQLMTYYCDQDTRTFCFKKQDWSYDDATGIVIKTNKAGKVDDYMQILDVKFHEDEAYLYVMEKIGSVTVADNQEKTVYGLVVYQRLSSLELIDVQNTYTIDKSDEEDKPNETEKVPDDCRYYIRCVYANSKDAHGMGDGHSKFQSFRLLSFDLTDYQNNNSSANPYYHYYDSIVWSCKGMPDREVSLRNDYNWSVVSINLTTYLFQISRNTSMTEEDRTLIVADGYKGGRVVYSSGIYLNIYNTGFMGYDFGSSDLLNPSNEDYDLYCIFDRSKRFRIVSPRYSPDFPEKPYSELKYIVSGVLLDSEDPESMKKHEAVLSEQKRMLVDLMDMYYGQYGKGVVVDDSNREKYRNRFKALPSDADLVMYWKGYTPVQWNSDYEGCLVALILKKNKENPLKSYYCIHAEPIK